jgi:hypothetical protein
MKLLLITVIFSVQGLVLELLVTVSVLLYGAAFRTVPDAEDKLSRLPRKCVFIGA